MTPSRKTDITVRSYQSVQGRKGGDTPGNAHATWDLVNGLAPAPFAR